MEIRTVGFIGAGRVANNLAVALSRAGYRIAAVASRSFASANTLASRIEGCSAHEARQEVVDQCDLVFITTPDDAIPGVAGGLKWRPGQAATHCSGADTREVLALAQRQGAQTGVLHPLQTFASRFPETKALEGITFSIEAEEPLLVHLKTLAEALGGRWVVLKSQDKVLYHAAAVIACNYMAALTRMATDLWATFGVGRKDACQALMPLMKQTLSNIEKVGLPDCLTGPIARGDAGTVRKHLTALHERAPEVERAYRELGRITLKIAEDKGSGNRGRAKELREILGENPKPEYRKTK